jgi:uncharacterized membrane protein YeaQ/YmgE (transglycosylase-associated protein family)
VLSQFAHLTVWSSWHLRCVVSYQARKKGPELKSPRSSFQYAILHNEIALKEKMMLLVLIAWLIIGGVAGWLAGLLVRGAGFGVLGDIGVGVIGGIIGGFLLGGTFGASGGLLWTFVASFLGAVILIFVVRLVTGNRTRGRGI